MARRIVITAEDTQVQSFRKRLQQDPALLAQLRDNPKTVLAQNGIEVDDDTAKAIRSHLSAPPEAQPAAVIGPVIAVAVAVGPAVAVAI